MVILLFIFISLYPPSHIKKQKKTTYHRPEVPVVKDVAVVVDSEGVPVDTQLKETWFLVMTLFSL